MCDGRGLLQSRSQMESHEDSSYNSGMDSDPESDPDSPEKLLNTWLGELDNLTVVRTSRIIMLSAVYKFVCFA